MVKQRNQIALMNVLYRITCLLHIKPHYDLQTRGTWSCVICKATSIMFIMILFISKMVYLSEISSSAKLTLLILKIFSAIMETGLTSSILLSSAFGNMERWKKILRFPLERNLVSVGQLQTLYACCVVIPLTTNGLCFIFQVQTAGYVEYTGLKGVVKAIQDIHTFISYLFHFMDLLLLRKGLQCLNKEFEESIVKIKVVQNDKRSKRVAEFCSGEVISKYCKTFKELCDVMKCINDCSCWNYLFYIGQTPGYALITLYLMVTSMEGTNYGEAEFLIFNISITLTGAVSMNL